MKLAKKLYCAAAVAMVAVSNSVFASGCFPTDPNCVDVPEPGSMALISIAVAGAVAVARRARK